MKYDLTILVYGMKTKVVSSYFDTAEIRIIGHGASEVFKYHISVANPWEGESMSFVIT